MKTNTARLSWVGSLLLHGLAGLVFVFTDRPVVRDAGIEVSVLRPAQGIIKAHPPLLTHVEKHLGPRSAASQEGHESETIKPSENVGKTGTGAGTEWLMSVRQQILAHQQYPFIARKRGLEGTIEVEVQLDSEGKVLVKKLVFPGKNNILENSALLAIEESSPFPRPPKGFSGTILVPIEFHLR